MRQRPERSSAWIWSVAHLVLGPLIGALCGALYGLVYSGLHWCFTGRIAPLLTLPLHCAIMGLAVGAIGGFLLWCTRFAIGSRTDSASRVEPPARARVPQELSLRTTRGRLS
jgi:hypothetical protein